MKNEKKKKIVDARSEISNKKRREDGERTMSTSPQKLAPKVIATKKNKCNQLGLHI